jgi:hypothetical protein
VSVIILPLVPKFPYSVGMDIAGLADVPACDQRFFCDCVWGIVRCVWEQHVQAAPRRALQVAAKATLELREAYHSFGQEEFVQLDRLLTKEPHLRLQLDEMARTLREIDSIFSPAIGRSVIPDQALGPLGKRGAKRKPGEIGEAALRYVVEGLLLSADCSNGHFTFDKKPPGRGTLLDALHVLRTHLPADTIPRRPPLSTIKRIIEHFYSVRA